MGKQTMIYPYHGILCSSKRGKLLTHAITWMDLKGTVLSEKKSQPQKVTYCITAFA